jgi:hypothetical protein
VNGRPATNATGVRGTRLALFWTLLFLCSALMLELVLRLFLARWLPVPGADARLGYRHDRELGWFPIAGDRRLTAASRPFEVEHNREGFRDVVHGPKAGPRILFLGDSFVWGFDVNADERFTDQLQRRRPAWEIVNVGVSGYGTDQEWLLLQKIFHVFVPDVVFLVYSSNDGADSSSNFRYGGYKPYFLKGENGLTLKGVPVPCSESYRYAEHPLLFRSYAVRSASALATAVFRPPIVEVPDPSRALVGEMSRWVAARGARFAVGVVAEDPVLKRFCKNNQIPEMDFIGAERYPEYGRHWTPAGHAEVASRVERFLSDSGWLPGSAPLETSGETRATSRP